MLYKCANCAFRRFPPTVCRSINAWALLPLIFTSTLLVSSSTSEIGFFLLRLLILLSGLSWIPCAAVLIASLAILLWHSLNVCPGIMHHRHFFSLISFILSAADL